MKRLETLVLHPFLFAAFPVLSLYSVNLEEAPPSRITTPLILSLGGTGLVLGIAWLLLRSVGRAGLIASIAVFVIFAYGAAHAALSGATLGGLIWGRHLVLIPAWFALGVGASLLALRAHKRIGETTTVLNLLAVALVAMALLPVVSYNLRSTPSRRLAAGVTLRPGPATRTPNIYYIILDRYSGQQTLRTRYKFDNTPFLQALRQRGFYVPETWANYPRTTHSLASSLNMQYLPELTSQLGEECRWRTLYRLLGAHRVGSALKGIGYRYVSVGSWWKHSADGPLADVDLTPHAPSEFSRILYKTTLPSALGETAIPALDMRSQYWRVARSQFYRLEQTRRMKGRLFVFAHILVPHEPFVFRRDGSYLTANDARARTPTENYLDQLQYVNDRILRLVRTLTAGPEKSHPAIIVQADEGMFPLRFSLLQDRFRWDRATPAELGVKLNILNVYYWPNLRRTGLYPSITPVNSFRLLFNRYFDADLPLLPDRIWAWGDLHHPCAFRDVTERVRPLREPQVASAPRPVSDP